MGCPCERPDHPLPARPARPRGRGARARRAPAARGRPRGRPAAGPRRSRHRQDHDAGRGDRRPDRAPRRHARLGARPHLLPQGRRAAARPGHRPRRRGRRQPPRARRSTPSPTAWSGSYAPGRALRRRRSGCSRAPEAGRGAARAAHRQPRVGALARAAARARSAPAASRARCRRCSPGRARRASTPPACARSASEHDLPEFVAAGLFLDQYLDVLDDQGAIDYADLIRRAVIEADGAPRRAAGARSRTSSSTSTRTPTPARSRCCARSPATAATSPWSATRTSRSTASAAPRCAASSTSRPSFPTADGRPAPVGRAAAHPPVRAAPAARPPAGSPAGSTADRQHRRRGARGVPSPEAVPGPHGDGRVEVAHLRHRARRGRAPRRPAAPGPPRGRHRVGPRWRCWSAPAAARSRRCAARSAAAGVPVEVASDDAAARPRPGRAAAARRAAGGRQPRQRRPRLTPTSSTPARAEALLLSPLAGLDAADVRALVRAAAHPREGAAPTPTAPAPSPRAAAPGGGRGGLPRRASTGPTSTAPLRLAALLHRGGPDARRRRRRRGGAVAPLVGHVRGRSGCGARSSLGGSGRPPRAPRPRRDRARSSSRARARRGARGHIGVATFLATLVAQQMPGRHPRRAGRPRRGGAAAHRPPVQGPRVATSSWSPTSSRRAGPTCVAAPRCSGPTGSAPTASGRRLVAPVTARAARRRSAACSTSPAPAPATTGGHRGRRRADDDGEQPSRFLDELGVTVEHHDGRPGAPAVAGRARRRAAPHARRPLGSRLRSARPPPAGWRRSRPRRSTVAARAERRPVDLVGHPHRDPVDRADPRPRAAGPGLGQHARLVAALPAQWFLAREAGGVLCRAPVGQPRPDRARPRRAGGRRRAARRRVDLLMAEVDAVWDRLEFRTPWSRRASTPGSARPWPASSPGTSPTRAPSLGTEQRFQSVVDVDGRARPAHRVRRPARGRRRRPRGRRRLQDRPHRAVRASPSRATSSSRSTSYAVDAGAARRGGRSRRRPAAPSSCSSASTTTPRAPRSRRQRPAARRRCRARRSCASGSPARPPLPARRELPRRRPGRTAATARSSSLCPAKGAGSGDRPVTAHDDASASRRSARHRRGPPRPDEGRLRRQRRSSGPRSPHPCDRRSSIAGAGSRQDHPDGRRAWCGSSSPARSAPTRCSA